MYTAHEAACRVFKQVKTFEEFGTDRITYQ